MQLSSDSRPVSSSTRSACRLTLTKECGERLIFKVIDILLNMRHALVPQFKVASVNRESLTERVKQGLHRLPGEYAAHYGILPPQPPETGIAVGAAGTALARAQAALGEAAAIAKTLPDAFLLSRIIVRKEAVSSSSIEGTHSTLDEILSVEESEQEAAARPEAKQVRDYALALESLVPKAMGAGNQIFSVELLKQLHVAVMHSDPDYKDTPGQFRSRVVWISVTSMDGRRQTSKGDACPDDAAHAAAAHARRTRGGFPVR